MTGRELWASLLQEAIQGKLVPQRDDESAVPPIGKPPEEVPFEIPEKWRWVQLKDVFTLQAGKFISGAEIKETGTYPCYGGNGIRGYVEIFNRKGRFPIIGRQGALCGNINMADGTFYATEHAVVVECHDMGDPDCVGYFLQAMSLNQYATATAQPGLAVRNIVKLLFPLPPLAEQRRIVAKLAALRPLVDEYTQAEERLSALTTALPNRLRASILQEAIQGKLVPQRDDEPAVPLITVPPTEVPFEIPEKWRWVQIRKLVEATKQKIPDQSFTYIDVSSIDSKTHTIKSAKKVSADKAPSRARKIVKNGIVLYSTVRPYLLNVCIAENIEGETIASTAFVTVKCSNFLSNKLFFYILLSPYFCNYVESVQKGVAYPAITDKDFYAALIPLPPLEEQHRIVAKLEQLLPEIDKLAA